MMESDEECINGVKQQICRLFYDNISVKEAIKLMRGQNVSLKMIISIYGQLFENANSFMMERFHYYTIEDDINNNFDGVNCWTSRYLLARRNRLSDSAFHEIQMIDLFNDRSM
jgi:hypothetical protein